MKISSLPNITITTIIITTGAGITIIITTIATDRRDLFASYNQMKKGSAPALPFFLRASRAFSSEVDTGPVAGLVGIEGGVVSGVFNLESSGVEASDWRPRHDEQYHEA